MAKHSSSTFTGVADVPIFYQTWLPGNGTPQGVVIVAHGLGEHSGHYTHLVNQLLSAGYVVYAIDHQGFGQSGGQRGHVNRFHDYAKDLHLLNGIVRAEQPGEAIGVFGHSLGGLIVLDYAQSYPDDTQCWISQSPALRTTMSPMVRLFLPLVNLLHPTFSRVRPRGGSVSRDPEEVRRFEGDPLFVPVSTIRWLVEFLAAQKKVMASAGSTPGPLLLLQGTADNLVSPAGAQEFYEKVTTPDKTLLTYDGYYHELHNDIGKEKPLGDIVGWLNEKMQNTKHQTSGISRNNSI